MNRITPVYLVAAVLVIAVVFQLFFRYQYIHTSGFAVTRVDRVSGDSCTLPCRSTAASTFTDAPTESQTDADARLVDYMRSTHHFLDAAYDWKITGHYDDSAAAEDAGGNDQDYPVRVVCYCDKKGTGWYYEARPDSFGTFNVMDITGNSVLEKKYGFTSLK